ncbi:ROK family transcriptional regulator [Luteimicrobium subarcticum]|uniref:Putative NBD/HSP70 family sugar kinase n=1 Tax=Luteimicrobium subarcticum TaxID=620910 RepID=A0A2M8WQL1_9MICO|nr:ROK family transcriptional regulator [Luteimicrobium subarcticum]PJI93222.1 putative NBD/HSP70 family sugar kinase [Luteimicrobium subarcticum]
MSSPIPGTPGLLRSINDRAALGLLLDSGPLTRVRISELTGVSRPTASQVVARLELSGLIETVGDLAGNRGPHALTYDARTSDYCGLALDVQPRSIRASVVDARGDVLAEPTVTTTTTDRADRLRTGSLPDVLPVLRDVLDRAADHSGVPTQAVRAVAIGVPGAVDPRTGDLKLLGDVVGWPTTSTRQHLESALGVPVTIANDVNLASIAEHRAATVPLDSSALLWLGSGIGLGLHTHGLPFAGASGSAGEIGYLPLSRAAAALEPDADELQDLVGGLAVVRLARRHGLDVPDVDTFCARVCADGPETLPAAFLDDYAERVAHAVAGVTVVVEPEELVIGGTVGSALGVPLAERVARLGRPDGWSTTVRTATVVTDPVLLGARTVVTDLVRAQMLTAAADTVPAS